MRSRRPEHAGATGGHPLADVHEYHRHDGDDKTAKKATARRRSRAKARAKVLLAVVALTGVLFSGITSLLVSETRAGSEDASNASTNNGVVEVEKEDVGEEAGGGARAPMGPIVYGAKGKGDDTARLVAEAIRAGFRHVATGGFHNEYNEPGVGAGWKEGGVPREELYLQTLFVANTVNGYGTQNCLLDEGCPPSNELSIEEQVQLSIRSSLNNLQTDYLDAVLVHNFRAKLQPYEETLRAWRALEGYVERGIVRHLGIVSVHDREYLAKLHADAQIKPSIVQNRFHSNRGYDVELRPYFQEVGMANQLFWILTGSAGGRVRKNEEVKALADKHGVSPQVLLYSFTMELGGVPLIGPKNVAHMKEDVEGLATKRIRWKREDLVKMAKAINEKLVPP